ncbi:MAG: hypothetical protein V4437_01095 [Patescibacteria group bacterium]
MGRIVIWGEGDVSEPIIRGTLNASYNRSYSDVDDSWDQAQVERGLKSLDHLDVIRKFFKERKPKPYTGREGW